MDQEISRRTARLAHRSRTLTAPECLEYDTFTFDICLISKTVQFGYTRPSPDMLDSTIIPTR